MAAATFTASSGANDTHASTTDGAARLFRKGAGKEAKLCFVGHLLMENRSGLWWLTQATGWADREAAGRLIEGLPGRHRITVDADRAYDTADFVAGLRGLNGTPQWRRTSPAGLRASTAGRCAIPATWRAGGRASGSRRRSPGSRPSRARPRPAAAYNLIRLPKLLAARP
jgi:hypothetical protein